MSEIYYYLLIPFSLSALGSLTFLYLFWRYEAVRLTFLMKHLAILQLLDFLLSFLWISFKLSLYPDELFCKLTSSMSYFLFVYQSYWLAVTSYYIYQVICINKERNRTCLLRYSLICFIISLATPIVDISLDCYTVESDKCVSICEGLSLLIDDLVFFCIFPFGYFISFFYNLKVLKRLKRDIQAPTMLMKITFFRILIYPFITLLSMLPVFSYEIYYTFEGENIIYDFVALTILGLMGLLYCIALGFTPEFIEAIRFHKRQVSSIISMKKLIS